MKSVSYLVGIVLVIFFLSGCTNLLEKLTQDDSPPIIINNCTNNSQPQNNSSCPCQPQNNATVVVPLTSQAPLTSLMSAPANYSSPSVPEKKYIDDIRIMDLETYQAPLGRALVARKDYEIIAENDKPFKDYVQFTVYVDNEPADSFNATCPQYCASPTMYSVPVSILDGDYKEIKVIVTDGAGLTGESMIYNYAKSESDAYYFAETCSLSEDIAEKCGELSSDEFTFYGSTISDGWAHGANNVPYNMNSNYSELCDVINSGGGFDGFFARTRCRFRHRFCAGFATVPDRVACTCNCTASVVNFTVTTEINIDFPNWTKYGSGTTCEKEHWNEFLQNTKTHEEGHALRCQDTRNNIDAGGVRLLTGKATAANCQAACDAAYTKLNDNILAEVRSGVNALDIEQERYDNDTGHGATQGAILNCAGC